MPYNNKDYKLVFVNGLNEERLLILLTNIKLKGAAIRVVRLYFYICRVEEYYTINKEKYDFENIRLSLFSNLIKIKL